MPKNVPRTARERARAEITAEITSTAREHLAEHGAAGLSLRAVSRELGMASSALYRYFPSRDALLTQLIIDAYNALGQACENADAAVNRGDHLGRWRAIARAARVWALANPHEYALVYGTPVPDYAAPPDTIDPASRVIRLLVALAIDLDEAGAASPTQVRVPRTLATQIAQLLDDQDVRIDRQRFLAMANAWALLFGMISFEVFGRYIGMFDDADALFDHQVDRAASAMGLRL